MRLLHNIFNEEVPDPSLNNSEGPSMAVPATTNRPGIALAESLDRKMLVDLRDGRKILGVLRSFDQFANIVLDGAVERIIVESRYAEKALGVFVIRGENVVLLGEVDESRDPPSSLELVDLEVIEQSQRDEKALDKIKNTMISRMDFLDFD